MSNIVIQVERLSKQYRLGTIGGRRLADDVNRWWAKARNKADPTLKIGQEHQSRLNGQEFKALQDVSFEVNQGEILGVIGRNGAGKSTLLKILSRVTAPTSGEVRVKGRIVSLLEVGTGFHPELTGRENIFLNGAVLGMNRTEIKNKFDEIVAFAEVEKFLDTPVKRYSSGMYVRLAFAVAAHLEPDILIIDEVLAVGDTQFQKKCLGKMQDVADTEGRTVVFVSHQMAAVNSLCTLGIVMDSGKIAFIGKTPQAIALYSIGQNSDKTGAGVQRRHGSGELRYTSIETCRDYYTVASKKTIHFKIKQQIVTSDRFFISGILRQNDNNIFQYDSRMLDIWITPKDEIVGDISFDHPWLKPGSYSIDVYICSNTKIIDQILDAATITIVEDLPFSGVYDAGAFRFGSVIPDFSINIEKA